MSPLGCERAQELLSDDLEGALDPLVSAELATHLVGCAECRALSHALADVMDLLRVPALEPAGDLAARVAAASWKAPAPPPVLVSRTRTLAHSVATAASWLAEVPFAVQAIAAAFAIALTAGLVMAAGSAPGTARRPRVGQRISEATVYVVERKDRLVEDLRLLGVVISTAFEGRLDRVNEKVDDYRRLLERRQNEQSRSDKKTEIERSEPVPPALRRPV